MGTRSLGGQHLCLPKICWTQNIGVHLELENLELECGPAQPDLFIYFSSVYSIKLSTLNRTIQQDYIKPYKTIQDQTKTYRTELPSVFSYFFL